MVILLSIAAISAVGQTQPVDLWLNDAASEINSAPEAVRVTPEGEHVITHVQRPSIIPYLPDPAQATGAAVIIAPGGGHSELWIEHEGYSVAEWFRSHGVAAFVLKYRLAREKGSTFTVEGTELGDMQRAIRMVRSRSKEWEIDPNRIGVMGFSAGGELAALASTRYDGGVLSSTDALERWSSKPDFQALLYPAIPHDPRLTVDTPRTFLACGGNDRPDISQGLPGVLFGSFAPAHIDGVAHLCRRRTWFRGQDEQSGGGLRMDAALSRMDGRSRLVEALEKRWPTSTGDIRPYGSFSGKASRVVGQIDCR